MPVQTTATLNVKTKGAVEASQQAAKISKTAAAAAKDQLRNTKEVEKELGRLQGRLKDVARHQIALNKAMEGVEKGSKVYKQLSGQLREVNKQQTDLERSARGVERAFKGQAEQMGRGSLLQGILQGAGAGPYLQRGPGMRRQAAGIALGRMGRGVTRGLGAVPFQGLGGLAQALQSIPGGGFLAAPLMQAAQASQQALQMQRVGLQTMPFLGGAGLPGRMAEYRGRMAGARAGAMAGLTDADIEKAARAAQKAAATAPRPIRTIEERTPEKIGKMMVGGKFSFMAATPGVMKVREEEVDVTAGAEAYTARAEELRKERARRVRKARERIRETHPFAGIRAAGIELLAGGSPEARQLAAQISQIGGGVGAEMGAQGMTRTAFAARTLFGVGPQVSGAFLQAGRRGGLVGGGGRAGEAMAEAIGDATRLGLEGSELNDYLGQIASGIQSWKDTGIPINAKSIGEMGVSMAGLGLGGLRGARVGAGLVGAAQRLSERGPQSAAELLMYQELGGYRGGGAAAFEQAQIRMERGTFGAEAMQKLLGRFLETGGRGEEGQAIGRGVFRRALRGMGIRVGAEETRIMAKRIRGEELTGEEQERITKWEAQAEAGAKEAAVIRDPEALAARAAAAIDAMAPNIKRQAIMANKQIEIGGQMVDTMQTLEQAQQNLAKTFTDVTAPVLKDMSDMALSLTETVQDLVTWIQDKIGDGAKFESKPE